MPQHTHTFDLLEEDAADLGGVTQDFASRIHDTQELSAPDTMVIDTAAEDDLRSFILGYDDSTSERHEIAQWGNLEIEIRGMNGKARAEFLRQSGLTGEGDVNWEALYPAVVIATCYHPRTGRRLFQTDDMDALNEKSAKVLEDLAQIGMRLSGMDKNTEDRAGKDSSSAPKTGSTSS